MFEHSELAEFFAFSFLLLEFLNKPKTKKLKHYVTKPRLKIRSSKLRISWKTFLCSCINLIPQKNFKAEYNMKIS